MLLRAAGDVSVMITPIVAMATLAFGAVYPWGYGPLFVAAAGIGLAGLTRQRGVPVGARLISVGLLLVALAVGAQLLPIPRTILAFLSPSAAGLLSRYSLAFAATAGPHPLSINPPATLLSLSALVGLGIYLVGLPGLLTHQDLRALTRNLTIVAVALALIGIYTREHNNGLVFGFWHPIEGDNVNGFGPFVNRNHFAGWMLMATSLTIGTLCGRIDALDGVKPGLRNRIVWLSTPRGSRITLVAISIIVMAISLVWTLSRSGIVSFACVLACFGWLVARRPAVNRTKRAATLLFLSIALLISLSWRGPDRLLNWFADTQDLHGRFAAWQDGWHVAHDFPVFGTGLNTYGIAMLFYQQSNQGIHVGSAHNDYVQVLAEGGLLVTISVAIAVVGLIIAIRRNLRAVRHDTRGYWIRVGAAVALIGIAVQETADFSLQIPANAFLFATLAALAISPPSKR